MRTSRLNWRPAVLLAVALLLFLVRPALAFDYTYSPTNTPPDAMYFNGSATNLADRFQLTPYQGSKSGAIVLDNLPKTLIKAFTVNFGLRMTNNAGDVMADGISFNFGPGITTASVADEKGITSGLAVAFDTYRNVSPADPSWVPGISIRWNGQDLPTATVNAADIFSALKTSTNFYDVTITLQPSESGNGLTTVTVQYQGMVLSAQVQYQPKDDEIWRMMLAGRTGQSYSEQSINQIRVTGTAAELTVISPYGAGQASPLAGTYQPSAFESAYTPANVQPGVITFNGSATNRTDLFLLTPNATDQHGSIIFNKLSQDPIREFTARFGLRMTSGSANGTAAANGVSFNFSPNISPGLLPDEKGITDGLTVRLDTIADAADGFVSPGMAILWKGSVVASSTTPQLFAEDQYATNFQDVVVKLHPVAGRSGISTVTAQYKGVTLDAQIAYAPASNEIWGVVIGASSPSSFKSTALARGENTSAGEVAANAIDNKLATKWLDFKVPKSTDSNTWSWIEARYPNGEKRAVDSYGFITAGDSADRDPAYWTFYGVKDDGSLQELAKNDGQIVPPTARGAEVKVDISPQSPAFGGYRLLIRQVRALATANSVQLAEVILRARPAPGSQATIDTLRVPGAEQSINRITVAGTALQTVRTSTSAGQMIPSPGVHESTERNSMTLQAPQYVYLDRYRRELAPTPENINSIARYRARLDDPPVTVTPSGGNAYSLPNGSSINVYRDTTVTWHWVVDNLAEVDSGTSSVTNLSATDITDPAHVDTLGRRYLTPGTTGFDSLVYRAVTAAAQGDVRFGSRGYVMENAPNSPERYLELAGDGDHLRATAATPLLSVGSTRFTIEFWARRNPSLGTSDQVVLGLGSLKGPGGHLFAGFGGDRGFFVSDGATRVSAVSGWTDEGWHHWAAVCRGNGDTNSVVLYRDGVLVQQSTAVFAPFSGDGEVTIGARPVADYATAFFSGGVNNVRVWGQALDRVNLSAALATSRFSNSAADLLMELPFDTVPTNSVSGVYVERLTGPAGIDTVADLAASYTLQDIYTTNNFLLPSTAAVASGNTNAWHHRSRLVSASGGRYTFSLRSSGIAQFWLDGQLLIDKPTTSLDARQVSILLSPGGHIIETWMIDSGGSRSLSLTYSPDLQLVPLAAIPDASLSFAASDLLAQGLVTVPSTEGNGLLFVARGFESLFPANTAGSTMLAAILPGFRLGLTALEGGQNSIQINSIGKAPLNDWRRVFWGWDKEFQFKVGVRCIDEAGIAAVSKLPYFAGEVAEANRDGSTSNTSAPLGGGVVNVLELWLREGERLSVGTVHRTPDRRYTLDGISGNLNFFSDITREKLIDVSRANGIGRQHDFPGVFGPGSLTFTYNRTIHRANIAIGQGFDVSSLAAINAVLAPQLPDGVTNLLVNLDGPSVSDDSTDIGISRGGNGQGWMWDQVEKRWHPTKPGVFTVTWPDITGYTNTIEVTAGFPGDTLTRSGFVGFENTDGTRQGSATNRYLATMTFPGVTTNFPGAPTAHYLYNLPLDGVTPAPADLDPDPNDVWFFKEFSYAENISATVNNTKIFTDTRAGNRSVLVFTRRPNPSEKPTGDLSRESVTVRVLSVPEITITNQAMAMVGSRLESSSDTAGFHSGRITPGSQNFNPAIYNTDTRATVGQWGPIYPVNYYSQSLQVGQPLSVDWYSRADVGAVLPAVTSIYTDIGWPDANNTTTPVIYLSSQMGSEGVGQAFATNGTPNYQEIFSAGNQANLAVYNQPDPIKIGYNPNEEHAFIAPSKAYVFTGDPRFNLGQSAAFALQNGLNRTNRGGTPKYTSDPFVLVQYSVPGATNASDAYAMKAYAVKTTRPGYGSFPLVDAETGTAVDASGQPVLQNPNPRYDFEYTAIAGKTVIPPYPLDLAIGNVVLTNTVGGNIASTNASVTRALWQDKNGNHWVVSGGLNARFFERYFYPLRADFWLQDGEGKAAAAGTPVAWAPAAATNAVNSIGLYTGSGATPVAAKYQAYWGKNHPVLKKGESLTHAGGEYKADHPASPGLPALVGMASTELVFDSAAPSMVLTNDTDYSKYQANKAYVPGVRVKSWVNRGRTDGYIESLDWVFSRNGKDPNPEKREHSVTTDRWESGYDGKLFYPVNYEDVFGSASSEASRLSLANLFGDRRTVGAWATKTDGLNLEEDFFEKNGRKELQTGEGSDGDKNSRSYQRYSQAYWLRTLLKIYKAGTYTFHLEAGDGARLFIGTNVVVNADGYVDWNAFYEGPITYRSGSGSIDLTAGYHVLEIKYFAQGAKDRDDKNKTHPKLKVQYQSITAGISKQSIPESQLFLDPDDPVLEGAGAPEKNLVNPLVPYAALSARVTRPLDNYTVSISREAMPEELRPVSTANVLVSGSRWYFKQLPASLGKRFYYDSLLGQLVFRGRLNDLESGDPKLTQQPVQSYVLEPNYLTHEDVETLIRLPGATYDEWTEAIEKLHAAASTAFTTGNDFGLGVVGVTSQTALGFYADNGADVSTTPVAVGGYTNGVGSLVPISSFGIGSALVGSPSALEAGHGPLYVTIAENNDPRASGAVALHIIQLSEERYRGSIKVITPQDAFSEKISLKHTGDFGGNTAEIYYQWYVRDIVNLPEAGTPDGVNINAWQVYQQGLGLNAIEFTGRPDITLADKLFFVRYGGKEELQEAEHDNSVTNGAVSDASWRHVLPDDSYPDWAAPSHEDPRVPFQWAGASNSPQLQADGSKRYLPQLVMGWVKRVLDQINLYEARYAATFNGDAPATYSSMLQQAGGPYIGPVALNSDKNNLENVGLIALYETVLQRAKDLTSAPGVANAGTDQAILLAATRLAFLYQLLGGEAFSDSQNSVVPQSGDSSAALSLNAFAFKNAVANPLQEELALLRGTDFLKAYPAFNRLFWNYFKADGEAFYNATYNISDANSDGLINESDAAIQYPMGHGDAWGHYLSATKMHFELLRRPGYGWLAQSELYSLLDNVLPVDYLDEKTFATIGADKVRAGSALLKATYRDAYVSDPAGQWQGYEDTAQPARAWGVSEWSRRIGQGAWFDWLAANAVTPARTTNMLEGLARIDRSTSVAETASVAAGLAEVQQILDQANRGLNPLGLDADAMAFQADPYYNGTSWERMPPFKQSLDKAIAAAQNAVAAHEFASQADQQLRRIADDTSALKDQALLQDLDYKNRLIAIYGRPYQGTIGPGKIFAEGYDGPDLVTYLYMNVVDPKQIKPKVQGDFVWQQSLINDVINVGNGLDFQAVGFQPNTSGGLNQTGGNQNQLIFTKFYLNNDDWGKLILNTPNRSSSGNEGDTLLSIKLPITEMADVALQAPSDWGSRGANGSIQSGLNDVLASQVDLEIALEVYNDYLREVQLQVFNARQKMDVLQEKAKFNAYYASLKITLESTKAVLEKAANIVEGAAKGRPKVTSVNEVATLDNAAPLSIGAINGIDIFFAVRAALQSTETIVNHVREKVALGLDLTAAAFELSAKITEISEEVGKETIESYDEFLEVLHELGETLSREEGQRYKLMAPLQKQNWAGVTSLIAEGERLQLERTALNRQIAAKAQRNRYADLVTRINRTEAMRKYDQALDNALRYAWLAVKTYDYETSLSDGHPASARALLDQIVKTRSLGNWAGGEPHVGNGGLAEILGQVSANYNALQGQIGLNNSQGEVNLLSLRTEMMRISPDSSSDDRWRQALTDARVTDLWQVPEFRQYCRPFAKPSDGPQPGLMLEFSTEIAAGKNFFGRPLSGLDHAFSPANYATKVRAFTAAFQKYDVDPAGSSPQLSISPRFYLVPVGLDRQYCSDTDFPTARSWNVVSQRLPVPYILNPESLGNHAYQLTMDGRDGSYAERIRFGDSRAFISDYGLSGADDMTRGPLTPGWNSSSRLYGRSAWNTRWLLIIPGATLNANKDKGLDRFVNTVTDIKFYLETYSNQGM